MNYAIHDDVNRFCIDLFKFSFKIRYQDFFMNAYTANDNFSMCILYDGSNVFDNLYKRSLEVKNSLI